MLKQVSGPLITHAEKYSVSEVVYYTLDLIAKTSPGLKISHYFVGDHLDVAYKKFSLDSLKKSLASGEFRNVSLAIFQSNDAARDATAWEFQVAISKTDSRNEPCLLIDLGFGAELLRNDIESVLHFSDSIAKRFNIQSGHLHDVEDFADQNQLGPHWFKITGKKLDPTKIKYSKVLDEHVVDIEQNPCHLHVLGAIDFTAAWTVYVGPEFLRALGSVDFQGLPGQVVRLDEDLYRVTLFGDPFEATEAENVAKMWSFRKSLKIDEIAHRHVTVY